ncbi:hypothetical protein DFJ43DRAFT_1068632 [Lentinula guzmanii]|uniref:Telomere-associated protein Rif1 N-terminal domain-containing protein n=1 Tax=Lentinula guzmanii TaxID=2804957 RepID=A0AA38JNM4_9AGAR|nr:hypothetical protein DFJ43DRAFT_1068632 [Lentinula guzmanii]
MVPSSSSSSIEEEAGTSAQSAHYLLSPLETLDESLIDSHEERIDLQDLIEAYNLLATRIKDILLKSSPSDQTAAPLTLLAERSQVLITALRRDVMRVMVNPFTIISKENEKREGMDLDKIHYARNLALLGQQAIRLTSELFAFPQLYSKMTVDQLRLLLHDILVILSEPSLPTPHSRRTFALLRWILQVQKLPFNVLSPHNSKIVACVRRSLAGEKEQVNVDGLKILAELLRNNPKLFLGPACDLLSDALKFLIAKSANLRSVAAHAVSAFAYAKVLQGLPYSHRQKVSYELSRTVRKFSIQYIEGEDPTQTPFLLNILQSSLKDSQLSFQSNDPQWAAVVIASFIVLIDVPLFNSTTLLKMKEILWQISDQPSATVRLLHTPVWKCFVWAFARIPADDEISRKVQTVISQDLRNGTGALLLHVMMNLNGKEMVTRILEVLTWMFDDKSSRQDGVVLLCHLLGSSGTPRSNADIIPILHEQLFDGKILDAHLADLMKHTATTGDPTVVRRIIRELSIQETIDHWERLHELWTDSVKYLMKNSMPDIQKPICTAWKKLLRADLESCQKQDQAAPSPKVAIILGRLCDEFAYKTSDAHMEVKQIQFLRMLWHVAQRLFSWSQLKETSNMLLTAIVRRDFQIGDMTVQAEWLKLSRIVAVDPASGEKGLADSSAFDSQTWVAVARIWTSIDDVPGDNLVTFLKLIFPERLATDEAIKLWGTLLRRIIADFRAQALTPESCIALWKTFATNDLTLALAFPKQFHALLSAFVMTSNTEPPEPVLLFLSNLLCSLYSPDHSLVISMQYIDTIRAIILSVSDTQLVSCISSLCNSLRCWMEDKSTIVPNTVYFQSIFPLYEDILRRLRQEKPNERTIGLLWKLFISPIERPVPSKDAIKAFEAFWLATYHGQNILFEPELVRYLKGLDMALGVGLAAGLTQSDDSQRTNDSLVPESSCLEPGHPTGSQILERHFDSFAQGDKNDNLEIVPSSSSPMHEPEHASTGLLSDDKDRDDGVKSDPVSPRESKRKRRKKVEEIVEETPPAISFVRVSSPETHVRRHSGTKSPMNGKGKDKAPAALEHLQTPVKRGPKANGGNASRSWIRESQLMTPGPSSPPSSHHGHGDQLEEEEEYGSWENAVVSPRSFAQISKEIDVDMGLPDVKMVERDRLDAHDDNDSILNSPSIHAAKRRKLSSITVGTTNVRASGRDRRRDRTTSSRILQLQQALEAFQDDKETPLEDLVKASKLVQEFGLTISEKLSVRTHTDRNIP